MIADADMVLTLPATLVRDLQVFILTSRRVISYPHMRDEKFQLEEADH